MRKRRIRILFTILGILVPILIILLLGFLDVSQTWDSWGRQEDGSIIYPGWEYLLLLLFKFSLYVFPPIIISIGTTIENKKEVQNKRYPFYLVRAFNIWFLLLLSLKLISDSILELDNIFGITLFNSIKDVQILIGFILTVIIKETIKIDPNQVYKK